MDRPDPLGPRPNVLITSASRKVPLVKAFVGATSLVGGIVIAADVSPLAAALYEAHDARLIPRSDDPAFIDALLELCERDRIGLIVPTRDEELPVFAAARERFAAAGTLVLVSSPTAIEACQDKVRFSEAVAAAGLETPRVFSSRGDVTFPAFVKPRRGKGGAGAVRVDDRAALAAALAGAGQDAVVQELVAAAEYTVDTFLDQAGRPITCVPRERIAVVAGESVVSRTVADPELVDATLRLCAAIGLVGHVTVQAFRTAERVLFIEVNPRFGGAAALSIEAGAGTPELAIREARGQPLQPRLGAYEAGLIMLRSASDRFIHDSELFGPGSPPSVFPTSPTPREGEEGTVYPEPALGNVRWRAVLFDLDDTLYAEHQFVDGGFRAAAETIGRAVGQPAEALLERLWALHGSEGRGRLFDALLGELGRPDDPELVLAALHAYRTHEPVLRPFDGMDGVVEMLDRAGLRLGVVSDGLSAVQRRKLAALGPLAQRFDAVVMTDELGPGFAKPSPVPFRLACRILDVEPSDAVYVANDPRKDFKGAREAGLATICFGSPPDEGGRGGVVGGDRGIERGIERGVGRLVDRGVDSGATAADDSDLVAGSVLELAEVLFAVADQPEVSRA